MRLNSKWFYSLLGLVIIFFLFQGVSMAAEKNDLTIAFVPRSLDNPIFMDTFESAQQEALDLGVKLEWVAPFTYSTEEQIKVINNLIRRKVDGIILSVDDVQPIRDVIKKAVDQGIVVATFDADSPGSERLFHIGIDNEKAGLAIGQALVQVIKNKGLEDKPLNTMIMTGAKDALNLNKRISGFLKATRDINLKITDVIGNKDSVNLAVELVEDYVKKHPEVDVIFFVGGWPFYVPAEAMPSFQKWAKNGGVAVGIDIFYNALLLQKEGLIDYLIGQDLASMGSLGLKNMVDYIRDGDQPVNFIETGLTYANDKNLDKLLKIYKPWFVK